MKRFSTLTLVIVSLTALLVGSIISWSLAFRIERRSPSDLEHVLNLIAAHYVDSVNIDDLQKKMLPILIANLDPHSAYIPKIESDLENERLNGAFCGIGVSFNTIIDTPVIIKVLPGGPSERAGLLPGDRILRANGEPLVGKGMRPDSVRQKLLGERASVVNLKILRDSKVVESKVVRDYVPISSIDVVYMLYDGTGLIRITQWGRTTPDEFRAAYARLRKQGLKSLIIDLRDNSGGYLESAIQLANEFLKKGQLIVYTKGKAYPREDYRATGDGLLQDIPLAVLVNELSASSSEVFAGAMQDHDRATIIGRRTFGKGLIQRPFYLPDSSQLRLTIARYYSPSGRCIQKQYTMGDMTSYQRDLAERYESGEMFSADSLSFAGAQQFKTDAGRIVYGGFGIIPSVLIPLDNTGVNSYYLRLVESGTMDEYAFLFVDNNRKRLSQYDNVEKLVNYLSTRNDLVYDYARFASKKGIQMRSAMLYESRKLIRRLLFAKIAGTLLDDEAAYLIFNNEDKAIIKGLECFYEELPPAKKYFFSFVSSQEPMNEESLEENFERETTDSQEL